MDAVEINTSEPPQNDGGIVSTVEICRVCLLGNLAMRDLFSEVSEVASLSAKAMSFANVKMLPDDGLPTRICCVCADKLESAYEFKLQVEQADTVLREKFIGMDMKEELFFNEVEVHLETDRNEGIQELRVQTHYQSSPEHITMVTRGESTSLMEDHFTLLRVENLSKEELVIKEDNNDQSIAQEVDEAVMREEQQELARHGEDDDGMVILSKSNMFLKCRTNNGNATDLMPTEEHDYILHGDCIMPEEQRFATEESFECKETEQEQIDSLAETGIEDELVTETVVDEEEELDEEEKEVEEEEVQEEVIEEVEEEEEIEIAVEELEERLIEVPGTDIKTDLDVDTVEKMEADADGETKMLGSDNDQLEQTSEEKIEHTLVPESSQSETRRSKRKSVRRSFAADRDFDEENYFENLNLSSRLKKSQADKTDKIFFACYLCDKEFLSKSVLKEHMHSHEEVRRALSLKKTPDKTEKLEKVERQQKSSPGSPTKMPPSGKRANKCPYCGKEYLYIISFSKHLKQHEKENQELKEDPMPLEVSFEEEEQSLDFDNNSQYRDSSCRKKLRREGVSRMTHDVDEEDENGEYSDRDKQRKRTRTEIFACDKCCETFSTRRGLRKHATAHISLKCSVCEEEFESLEKLRNHRTKHVVEGVLTEQDLEEDNKRAMEREMQAEIEARMQTQTQETDLANDGEPDDEDAKFDKKTLAVNKEGHHTCKICGEEFSRRDQLVKHAEEHTREKSYKCTQCNKIYGNELTLRNHLIATNHKTFIHGQEYDPNKRIKRVAAKAAQKIIDKIKTEDGLEDYDDDVDDEKQERDDRSDYDANYSRKRDSSQKKCGYGKSKDWECASCNRKCTSKYALAKHMEQHVKDEKNTVKLEKSDKLKKPSEKKEQHPDNNENNLDDGEDDDDNSDFESGLDWPMDSYECTTCKKRYSTKKSLLRHQLLHEEPNFECDICNVKFYRKDKLKAHYDKCSEKNPDQVRKCNICGDTFENNEILREHRSKHVTEGILTEEDLRDIEPRPEEKKQGEKIGRKRRTDIVGLECTECNKQYTSRKGLLRHIQVHEGKKYLCDICPKKFYRREHLKIHVAKHNMIKPYKCTRCTKRFIKEEQLTNHLSKHDRTFKKNKETDSSKRFLCEICSKSFTQSTTLIAHLRAHNGIKPYVCEVCSRPFTTNAYLKMHMRTHTQERPYICQYCSRAFARADTLANHLTSHTGEAKYHCKYCPKNFRRLKSLKEHVFIHTGQRPYACPTCDRRFNNNGSRYAHSKRCKQNFVQNQNRAQSIVTQVQTQSQPTPPTVTTQTQNLQRVHQTTLGQAHVQLKTQNIKTITIARQPDAVGTQHSGVMQHQEILMPLILPLTVTLTDVGEEVILPEGTKIFTTS